MNAKYFLTERAVTYSYWNYKDILEGSFAICILGGILNNKLQQLLNLGSISQTETKEYFK